MEFDELILRSRSYRRFHENEAIPAKTLSELAGLVRLCPSSGNIQAVRLFLSNTPEVNARIFPFLRWAFYLKDWDGPAEGERPSAYVMLLWDKQLREPIETDIGIAAQTILLGAASKGYGGCMIASIDRVGLRKEFGIPEHFQIPLILALGKPHETVIIEKVPGSGSIEYWRDDYGVHHVPKRSMDEIILTRF